jgi:hypothetical protein
MVRSKSTTKMLGVAGMCLCALLAMTACDDDDDGGSAGSRTVYGIVSDPGAAQVGPGHTASHLGVGGYRVVFDVPYAATPAVTVTVVWDMSNGGGVAQVYDAQPGQFDVRITDTASPANFVDRDFHFVAVGD